MDKLLKISSECKIFAVDHHDDNSEMCYIVIWNKLVDISETLNAILVKASVIMDYGLA